MSLKGWWRMAATHSGALAEAVSFYDALTDDLKASEAEVAKAAETIAELEARVKTLEATIREKDEEIERAGYDALGEDL